MKIILTNDESENYFYNALCNGLHYMGGYGLQLQWDENEYDRAKGKWEYEHKGKDPIVSPQACYEDILMQILKDGGTLTMVDLENGEDDKVITLDDVHKRVQTTPLRHLMNMVNEEDDAETADVILQTVFYQDVIFG